MTRARVVIELPEGQRVSDFERDLAALAAKYGTTLDRSHNPHMPLHYEMRQRYSTKEDDQS